jgi:hypothetical protein
MGTEEARKQTEVHNAAFTNHAQNAQTLNDNVTQWLLGTVNIPDDEKGSRRPDTYSVRSRFLRSLFAPNYTVFSNTASQNQWIKEHGNGSSSHYVVSLESPHNAIHLALGGFYEAGAYNANPIRGANGDMGDNDTASFDPIFFIHHCFIDYAFAVWQRLWGFTTRGSLTVIPDYNGTILKDGQPPNHPPGTHLDMTTPLYPFQMHSGEYYNSDDVTDLNDLGYTYGPGSLDALFVSVDPASQKSPSDTLDSQFDHITLAERHPHVGGPLSLIQYTIALAGSSPTAGGPHALTQYGLDTITPAGSDPSAGGPLPLKHDPKTLSGSDPTAGGPLALTPYGLDPITLAGSDPTADNPFPVIKWVHHINRAQFKGSFVIRLYAQGHDGKEVEVGREAVLSRWDLQGCRNCQGHLDVDMYVPIDATTLDLLQGPKNAKIGWRVYIQTHELLHHTADPGEGDEEEGEAEGVFEPEVDDL